MQTRFRRHQAVKIRHAPDAQYIEYHNEDEPDFEEKPIKAGMHGRINIILPNGQYHVEITDPDDKNKILAYAPFDEDDLEAA